MNRKHLNLLSSVATFAVNAEESTENLSQIEIVERLQASGLDLMKLDALTVRKVAKLHGRLDATSGRRSLLLGQRDLRVAGKLDGEVDSYIAGTEETGNDFNQDDGPG